MFFALGVLVAGLLGLMILPALWRRAVRLSTRRLEMQRPLSMEEVLADRDLLRAEFAVAERRLEVKLATEQDARTRDRAELGRKTAALIAQSETIAALRDDYARAMAMLTEANAHAIDLHAQLGAAMIEAHDGLVAREKYEALGLETRRAQQLAKDQQLVIAGLETRLAGAEAQWRDAQRECDAREKRISELDDARAELNRKLGDAILPPDDASLRHSIADLGAEVLRISQALEGRPAKSEKTETKRAGKSARASVD